MRERLSRHWRVIATGTSFTVFGSAALLLRLTAFPLIALLVRAPQRRIALARSVIRLVLRAFIEMMSMLGVLRYEFIGRERLARGGLLILANHPTLIDTLFLMAFVEHANCIVKGALVDNPFTGGPVRAAGYINNDRGVQLVDDCIASLEGGNNLIVFPEGTRTPRSGAIAFKRGAAHIALRGARAVTPVRIVCLPLFLGKGEPWWQVPLRRPRFRIEVCADIAVERFRADGVSDVLAARRMTDYLQSYLSEETEHHA